MDILEIFQEIFHDIENFEEEMDVLNLVNKTISESESYLLAEACHTNDTGEDQDTLKDLPEYELVF